MTTTTKTRKKLSPAQREAAKSARQAKVDKINVLMAQAEEQGLVEVPEDFAKSFERYSPRNQLLVLLQRPEATQVAGYRAWQAEGRQVKRGEKGIMIFGPSRKKTIKEEKDGKEEERTISFAPPVVTVFDISQTEEIAEA